MSLGGEAGKSERYFRKNEGKFPTLERHLLLLEIPGVSQKKPLQNQQKVLPEVLEGGDGVGGGES